MYNLLTYDVTIQARNKLWLDDILDDDTYKVMFEGNDIHILNKGMCGNGGTTGFINYAKKHSKGCLILVPNRSIAVSKDKQYNNDPEICSVYSGCDIINPDARIVIATYDQYKRILEKFKEGGFTVTDNPFDTENWIGRTIIIDEYHKLIDECNFRDICIDLTTLIKDSRRSVILMSATPHIEYINMIKTLVNKSINTYNVQYNEDLYRKSINVYNIKNKDVKSVLNYVKSKGQVCVFYNNVEELVDILKDIGDDDCELLCSKNNSKGQECPYYSEEFQPDKHLHFMTSAYFTGHDIDIDIDHCIIFGSRHNPQMWLGERDIKQMLGRFRKYVDKSFPIQLFYIDMKTLVNTHTEILDNLDQKLKLLDAMGNNWVNNNVSIRVKQESLYYQDAVERFTYWNDKKTLMHRLMDYGYNVRELKLGEFINIKNRKIMTLKEAKKGLIAGKTITWYEYPYIKRLEDYRKAFGDAELIKASRNTIFNWWNIREGFKTTEIDEDGEKVKNYLDPSLLTEKEWFKMCGLNNYGCYSAKYLKDCMNYIGIKCGYERLNYMFYDTFGCYLWLCEKTKRMSGYIYCIIPYDIIDVKNSTFLETQNIYIERKNLVSEKVYYFTENHLSYLSSYQKGHRYGKTISIKNIIPILSSLTGIPAYDRIQEDKTRLYEKIGEDGDGKPIPYKKSDEWQKIKNYKQTLISEFYKEKDGEYHQVKDVVDTVDTLIVDIDEGPTFSQFKEMYSQYVWYAYPTINNIDDDWTKFRVIIPLASKLHIIGKNNMKVLKMLRILFCPYEDTQHMLGSYANREDWLKGQGNNGEILNITQETVERMYEVCENLELAISNRKNYFKKLKPDTISSRPDVEEKYLTLDWAQQYFKDSFTKPDGGRNKALFIIKNRLNIDDRQLFERWLAKEYTTYLTKWKNHSIIK